MPIPRIYRETLPVLLLSGVGLVVAGLLFQGMSGVLERTPGLLIMVPALIAVRGGINGAMGSRLGSAFHMGLIGRGNLWNEDSRENVAGVMILNLTFSVLTGALTHLTAVLLGLPSAGFLVFVIIAGLVGTLAGAVAVVFTFLIIILAFRRGLDPDNITSPSLLTIGDIITMLLLFGVAVGLEGFL